MKPLSSFIVLLRTPFLYKSFQTYDLKYFKLVILLLPLLLHSQPLPSPTTNFISNNVSNKVYIMLTICTTFFSRQRKEKLRFWKLFGIKVSFLKSFSCVSFNYTGSSAAKIIHNRKIKTICILNGRERDFVAVLYRNVFDLLY